MWCESQNTRAISLGARSGQGSEIRRLWTMRDTNTDWNEYIQERRI